MDLRFDWHAFIEDSNELNELLALLIADVNTGRSSRGMAAGEFKDRAINEERIARQLLTALYNAYFTMPRSKVSLPLTASHYGINDSAKVPYSYRSVKALYDSLRKLGWITIEPGIENKGYTRIAAAGYLGDCLDSQGFRWQKQQPNPPESLVVLRDRDNTSQYAKSAKKKITLSTPETEQVREHRQNLFKINSFLTSHCISLNLTDESLVKLADTLSGHENKETSGAIDFSRVQLRRIFSRGEMSKGGRFYGGFWQSLPSIYRQHIQIDDRKTCEVDYSAIALRIIYAKQGKPFPIDQDPYDIGMAEWTGTDDARRSTIKTYVNALINDETGNYRLPKEDQSTLGVSHDELKELVLKTHKSIAHVFSSGAGLDAQYIDSQIAERVMLMMMEEGQVALPIHDSFIVRLGFQHYLEAFMEQASKDILGTLITTTSQGARLPEHFGISSKEYDELPRGPEDTIVNGADLWDPIKAYLDTTMFRYVQAYERWSNR